MRMGIDYECQKNRDRFSLKCHEKLCVCLKVLPGSSAQMALVLLGGSAIKHLNEVCG